MDNESQTTPKHRLFEAAVLATHSRPAVPVYAPAQIDHALFLIGEAQGQEDRDYFVAAIDHLGWDIVQEATGEVLAVKGRSTIKWERHTEFVTLTAIAGEALGTSMVPQAFEQLVDGLATRYAPLPGEADRGLFLRTRILVGHPNHDLGLNPSDGNVRRVLVVGDSIDVETTLMSDSTKTVEYRATLRPEKESSMSPARVGRFVQRLVEIESYRLLAYLAVPMMQQMGPRVSALEAKVNDISQRAASDPKPEEEAQILTELTALSAELQSIGSASEFRFAASLAYSAIVDERIDSLRENRVESYQRISTAIKRRLDPAMRSCSALLGRQHKIAERISYVTDLLRTRVDLALQDQNAAVLQSIDKRARAQLRLQQAVEGLSVAAITYYLLGIIYYLVKGAPLDVWGVNADLVQAGFVLPVAGIVYWGLRRVRQRNEAEDRDVM